MWSLVHNWLTFIFFKLTIFGLLCIKLYQLAQQYMIPLIREQIAAIIQKQNQLIAQEKHLKSSQNLIQEEFEAQAQALAIFEEKLATWHQTLIKKHKQQEDLNRINLQTLTLKKKHQYKQLKLVKMEQQILPSAIEQAKKILTSLYSETQGKILLEKTLPRGEKK